MSETITPADEWAKVEIFGHRQHVGRISEVERFGSKMLRIDEPTADPEIFETHFYGGGSIFSISPVTEAAAREWVARYRYRTSAAAGVERGWGADRRRQRGALLMTTAYPLAWPEGWPRTEPGRREKWPANPGPTVAGALKEVQDELRRLGVSGVVLSSNVTLGAEKPADPGVVAYGTYQKQNIAIPCDRWNSVAGNLRAIAKTIEAMRGMERWGAKHMIRAMFQGFTALPAATAGQRHWRQVLDIPDRMPTRDELEIKRRAMARTAHPDMPGGSDAAMAAINAAFDQAVKELGLA